MYRRLFEGEAAWGVATDKESLFVNIKEEQ